MDPERIVFLVLQVSTFLALVVVLISLYRAIQLKSFLSGRPGGSLAAILAGVVVGLAALEGAALINTFIASSTAEITPALHFITRALQQIILITTTLWAWWRIEKLR